MLAQLFAAAFGDQIIVFESHSALPFDVAAGFECDYVASNQRIFAFRDKYRWFGVLQGKAMSCMMCQWSKAA